MDLIRCNLAFVNSNTIIYLIHGYLWALKVVFEVTHAAKREEERLRRLRRGTHKHQRDKNPVKKWQPRTFLRRLAWRDLAYWALWFD